MKKMTFFLVFALSICLSVQNTWAKVKLATAFSNNMVLQQQSQAAIWGWATAGKTINIQTSWNHKKYTTAVGADGKWKIKVATPKFGGPYQIHISDGEELVLDNILIGDVWLCSGQSNMEMPLAGWGKIANYEEEIKAANYPQIRLLQAQHQASKIPMDEVIVANNGWTACTPATIAGFSATAYFFAREVYQKTGIPIGLIQSAWGGTVAEAWISGKSLQNNADFATEAASLLKSGQETGTSPLVTGNVNKPTLLYNGMIHPLIQFTIKGAIWYQGESNAGRANQYRSLFPSLINDWRNLWGMGNFPFYFVQLANYNDVLPEPAQSDWAELRDAQLGTLKLANTGMAVAIDIGEKDIHPKNKQDVGKRLALIALAKTYKKENNYSGPMFSKVKFTENTAQLSFTHIDGGLVAKNGALKGFAVAGADQKFYLADASIVGNHVVVKGKGPIVAVRYAWATNPLANLYNGAGLPASPFKTDNWKDSTAKP